MFEATGLLHAPDFDAFHRERLPLEAAGARGGLAGRDVRDRAPLALRVVGKGSYTYRPADGSVAIEAGETNAATVVELDADAWWELASEIRTAPGLLYANRLRCVRGDVMDLVGWEPALRALYHGRPIFIPGEVDLHDIDGLPLDLHRSFQLDSAPAAMRHFLEEAGYLVVRDVFATEEVARLKHESERVRATARPGDGKSWWGVNASGETVLCRVTYAGERSGALARLFDDERIQRLVAVCGRELLAATDRFDGATVLFKNPRMVSGLSDLPWHRDCGLGGHSVICPLIVVGLHLEPMTPETGELRVLPGSWNSSCHFMDASDPAAPPGIGVSAQPGDCTLHYGDLMHAAPAPTGIDRLRTTIYLTFLPERAFRLVGPGQAYNDLLLADGSGRVKHLLETVEQARR